jgi:hypothetical protein
MPKPIEHHVIVMREAPTDKREHYGVLYESCLVYDTTKSHSPTRLVVWDNTNRPFRADRATWNTSGAFLDPHNNGTDDPVSFLLSPESTCICADTRMNTGQPGSGQVYARGERLGEADTATLIYPDMTALTVALHFTNNGHGIATATGVREAMTAE